MSQVYEHSLLSMVMMPMRQHPTDIPLYSKCLFVTESALAQCDLPRVLQFSVLQTYIYWSGAPGIHTVAHSMHALA